MNELKSWSYSKYSLFKQCPLRFKLRYLDKIDEGPAPARDRGIRIHEEAENYLDGSWKTVPESCEKLKKQFKTIRDKGYKAEEFWGFDEHWNPVDPESKEAFVRMKIDAHGFPTDIAIKLIDYKTGKVRDDYWDQLELYSIAAFSIYDIEEAINELWYLDHGVITPEVIYKVENYERLVKKWNRRIEPMFEEKKFRPTPNYLCKNYCPYASHKMGLCKHGK